MEQLLLLLLGDACCRCCCWSQFFFGVLLFCPVFSSPCFLRTFVVFVSVFRWVREVGVVVPACSGVKIEMTVTD